MESIKGEMGSHAAQQYIGPFCRRCSSVAPELCRDASQPVLPRNLVSLIGECGELGRELWKHELEFDLARRVQERFFPAATPSLRGIDLHGFVMPAQAAGGDYFDYLPMAGEDLGVVIGDVSGHGMGAALVMAVLHAYLRVLARMHSDPGAILEAANEFMIRDTLTQQFATVFLVRLSPVRMISYVGAGHEAHLCRSSGEIITLDATGPPLGLLEEMGYPVSAPLELQDGDVLLLSTDGLAESVNCESEMFGKKRMLGVLRASRRGTAHEIAESVFRSVWGFANGVAPIDDQALVVIKAVSPDRG